MMRPYTNLQGVTFSGELREEAQKKINAAIRSGKLPSPSTQPCEYCSQDQGIRQWHNEDYDKPLEVICLCWRCHMMLHSRFRAPAQFEAYLDGLAQGKKWPPVFSNDFGILERDHGVPAFKHTGPKNSQFKPLPNSKERPKWKQQTLQI